LGKSFWPKAGGWILSTYRERKNWAKWFKDRDLQLIVEDLVLFGGFPG
jgi:hypothetical protein